MSQPDPAGGMDGLETKLHSQLVVARSDQLLFGWLIPFGSAAALLLVVAAVMGSEHAGYTLGLAASVFTLVGKFAVFFGLSPDVPVNPWEIAAFVVYLDFVNALFVTYNFTVLYRLPFFGARIRQLRRTCLAILSLNPWMRRFAAGGVALFVAFPVGGTGALGGSVLSQVLGLRRWGALLAILAGAVLGSVGMAAGAVLLGRGFEHTLKHPVLQIGVVILLILGIAWVARWFRRQATLVDLDALSDAGVPPE